MKRSDTVIDPNFRDDSLYPASSVAQVNSSLNYFLTRASLLKKIENLNLNICSMDILSFSLNY